MGAGWAATATAWASSLASGLVGEVGAAMDPRFKETAMGAPPPPPPPKPSPAKSGQTLPTSATKTPRITHPLQHHPIPPRYLSASLSYHSEAIRYHSGACPWQDR